MEMLKLEAKKRPGLGSRKSWRLRGEGWVPGVLYGKGKESVSVQIGEEPLVKFLRAHHQMLTLSLEGEALPALIKAVQTHPLTGELIHVDFARVDLSASIKVKVKVVLKGVPVGVTAAKGVLEQQGHEVEVECLPTAIPDQIVAKIDHLEVGMSLHAGELALPAGVKIAVDADRVIATVHAPKIEEVAAEAAPAEVATQPEVIGAKEREERAAAKAGEKGAAAEPKEKEAKEKEAKEQKK